MAGQGSSLGWDRSDLRHPWAFLSLVVTFALVMPAAVSASCNVHEVGHAIVGRTVGWEVERINLCLPFGGSVEYGDQPRWAGNVQGYAGGLFGAGFLVAVYAAAIARRRRPLQSPAWWAAGLGVVSPVGIQLVLAGMEGSAGPGEDYEELFQDFPLVFFPLVLFSLAAAVSLYVWRWRVVWSRDRDPARSSATDQ